MIAGDRVVVLVLVVDQAQHLHSVARGPARNRVEYRRFDLDEIPIVEEPANKTDNFASGSGTMKPQTIAGENEFFITSGSEVDQSEFGFKYYNNRFAS